MKPTKLIVVATLFLSIGSAGCASNIKAKTPKIRKPYGYTELETYQEKIQDIYAEYFVLVWGRVVDENDVPILGAGVGVFLDGRWHEEQYTFENDGEWDGKFFVRVPKNRRVFIGASTDTIDKNSGLLKVTGGVGQFVDIGEYYFNDYDIKLMIKRKGPVTLVGKVYKPPDYAYMSNFDPEVEVSLALAEMPNFIIRSTNTDGDGNFLIDNLQPGDYHILAFKGRYVAEVSVVNFKPGSNHLDLYLKEDKKSRTFLKPLLAVFSFGGRIVPMVVY